MIESKKYSNYNTRTEEGKAADDAYDKLDIWRKNPAHKDSLGSFSIAKLIVFIVITTIIYFSALIITSNIYVTFGLVIILIILFLIAFHDDLFYLEKRLTNIFSKFVEINPFEKFKFFMLDDDNATVLIVNKKHMTTIATRIFKIGVLPENVKPTINQFLSALDESKISYTYQVVQRPIITIDEISSSDKKKQSLIRTVRANSIESFKIHIYFSVYHKVNGILSNRKLNELIDTITIYSDDLKSNFSANFHHTRITLLKKEENQNYKENEEIEDPINAIQTIFFKEPVYVPYDENVDSEPKIKIIHNLFKLIFSTFVIGYFTVLLLFFNVNPIYILGVDIAIACFIVFLWWRDLLFYYTDSHLKRYRISEIKPFSNVEFYQFKAFRDIIYLYINNSLLIATKMFNLGEAIQPSFAMPDKFFRVLNKKTIPFIYTLNATPIDRKEFVKKCTKKLHDKTKEELEGIISIKLDEKPKRKYKYPQAEYINWMEYRTAIWKIFLTISTSSYKFVKAYSKEDLVRYFYELKKDLYYKAVDVGKQFQKNFKKLFLTQLQGQQLISGFQGACFKNPKFRLGGSYLWKLYFQGVKLKELTNISNEFRRGIETRIAAEFNTPTGLENFITIGHTINTEFLEDEVPTGFTFKQLKQLLITNGTSEDREHLTMKIVAELTKADIPCIIFDYSGNWSKLIRYFEDSQYKDRFLHFKFGQSFNVNLINSGLKYDYNNIEYLNYFYDVFALAFKVQKGTIDLIKKTIHEKKELDWSTIGMEIKMTPELGKMNYSGNLLNLFRDFLDQGIFFSDKALEYENDIAPVDFIKANKTVIIDLSPLKDLEQKTFGTFVILAKFIHYINYSNEYHKKIILIPNVDIFFDQYYIDQFNTVNYGKIDKLLSPLLQGGFGLIFSANQIRYLHPNVFNFMRNIATFQATDPRDIAVLKNNMHLQELHGAGYYSSKRNNTYQIEYLKIMRNNEIIVKREDNFQPFPVNAEFKKFVKALPISDERIYKYMERQGYNLIESQQKLMAKLKGTLFEKDFGIYMKYIDDVKKFLDSNRKVDKIGNLTKKRLKEELFKFISPTASEDTQNRKKKEAIRNDIFNILIKQGYLEESHPPMAGGGESTHTSYAVGQKYQIALDDEIAVERERRSKVEVERLENNEFRSSSMKEIFNRPTESKTDHKEILINALSDKMVEFYIDLSKMYKLNNEMEYEKSLDFGKKLIIKFFINLHKYYISNIKEVDPKLKDIDVFVEYLIENNEIPFTKTDLHYYLRETQEILSDNAEKGNRALRLYDLVMEFHAKLKSFIYPE